MRWSPIESNSPVRSSNGRLSMTTSRACHLHGSHLRLLLNLHRCMRQARSAATVAGQWEGGWHCVAHPHFSVRDRRRHGTFGGLAISGC